ncbi:DUF5666 domain-containing protein [Marinimicrobium locisalis]|uniref:DUF5666 domain-containing protein n=1 Tax=Marinimicrobium locisalis TaxID=546022 RepID=UPI0032218899
MKHLKKSVLATSIAMIMTGCGGSSGDSDPNTDSPDQTDSSSKVSSSGVITGFGSIYVNGVRYDTASAEVEFEGKGRMSEDDLRLGMRVEIEAAQEGEGRRATRVVFDKDLKGPVSTVTPDAEDPTLGTLVVLGQSVTVDANTVVGSGVTDANMDGRIDLNDLSSSEGRVVVEVSGFPTDAGFVATRLERLNGGDDSDENEAEVKGVVAELDTANGTFMVRGLEVHYDLTALEDDLEEGQLSEGWFVEVEGEVQADGSLQATKIEREDDRWEEDDEREGEFEVEGIVQAVDTDSTPNSVTINGAVIPMADASVLVGLVGTKVELEGSFNAEGQLEIDADDDGIKREWTNNVEVSDRVETVGATSFTTRMGVTVTPTGLSRVEDDNDEDGDHLKPEEFMARLQAGDAIEARGYLAEDGTLTWSRIERDDDDGDQACSLRAPVEAGSIDVSTGTFTMLGVTIDTASILDDGAFGGDDDSSLGRVEFFSTLSAGAVVEAEGNEEDAAACSDGLLVAAEAEFESDDEVNTTYDRDEDDADEEEETEENEQDGTEA